MSQILKTFWHIVPIGDGYNVLCYKDNILCNVKKTDITRETNVVKFTSKKECDEFIDSNGLKDNYISEEYISIG